MSGTQDWGDMFDQLMGGGDQVEQNAPQPGPSLAGQQVSDDDNFIDSEPVNIREMLKGFAPIEKNTGALGDGTEVTRVTDRATEQSRLDDQLIESREFQAYASMAKFFGFQDKDSFKTWFHSDPVIQKIAAGYSTYRADHPDAKEQVQMDAALTVGRTMENQTRKDFTHLNPESQKTWRSKQWAAYAMHQFEEQFCTLQTGIFHHFKWSTEVRNNRMWALWRTMNIKALVPQTQDEEKATREATGMAAMSLITASTPGSNGVLLKKIQEVLQDDSLPDGSGDPPPEETCTQTSSNPPKEAAQSGSNPIKSATQSSSNPTTSTPSSRKQPKIDRKALGRLRDAILDGTLQKKTSAERKEFFVALLGGMTEDQIFETYIAGTNPTTTDFRQRHDENFAAAEGRRILASLNRLKQDVDRLRRNADQSPPDEQKAAYQKHAEACAEARKHPDARIADSLDLMAASLFKSGYNIELLFGRENADVEQEMVVASEEYNLAEAGAVEEGLAQAKNADVEATAASGEKDTSDVVLFVNKVGTEEHNQHASSKVIARLMGNTDWEESGYFEACEQYGIDPTKRIRLPGMRDAGAYLTWYQLCQVQASFQRMGKLIKGPVLAGSVGMGKTHTAGGIMIRHFTQRITKIVKFAEAHPGLDDQQLSAEIRKKYPNRPFLLILPKSLITQWAATLNKMSPHFEFHLYHRDSTAKKAVAHALKGEEDPAPSSTAQPGPSIERFNSRLYPGGSSHRLHPRNPFKIPVILTTTNTFANRHGPPALWKDRQAMISDFVKKGAMAKTDARAYEKLWHPRGSDYRVVDPKWKYLLGTSIEMVFVDESQVLRNPNHVTNVAIQWNDFKTVIPLTATPIWTGIGDIAGQLALIQTPEAVASVDRLLKAQPPNDITTNNPYNKEARERYISRGKDEPARKARERFMDLCALTCRGWQHFVLAQSTKGKPRKARLVDDGSGTDNEDEDRVDLDLARVDTINRQADAIELVFRKILIRHSYSSSWPKGVPANAIGRELPDCYRYSQVLNVHRAEANLFDWYGADHRERLMMPQTNASGALVGMAVNGNAHRALMTSSALPVAFLVGIPKDAPWMQEQRANIEAQRDEFVRRKQDSARRDIINQMRKEVKKQKAEKWPSYPHDPEIPKEKLPSRDAILSKFWYKYDEEYTLMETDIVRVFDRIRKAAPADIDPDIFLLWQIHTYAQACTFSVNPNTPAAVLPGNQIIRELPPVDALNTFEGRQTLAVAVTESSPKLKMVIAHAWDCVHRKEKATFWAAFPSTQMIILATLRLHGLSSDGLTSDLDSDERARLVDKFNDRHDFSLQFFVLSYHVGGLGLNLQHGCHVSVAVDPPSNIAMLEQMIGRFLRMLQPYNVLVYLLRARGLYDEQVIAAMFNRCAAEIKASLDPEVLAQISGLVLDPHVADDAKRRKEFMAHLKEELEGFYVATENGVSLLRHRSSFPIDDEEATDVDEPGDPPAQATKHKIPPQYEETDKMGVLRYLFRRMTGFDFDAHVLGDPSLEALTNELAFGYDHDMSDAEDKPEGPAISLAATPLEPFEVKVPGCPTAMNLWDLSLDQLKSVTAEMKLETKTPSKVGYMRTVWIAYQKETAGNVELTPFPAFELTDYLAKKRKAAATNALTPTQIKTLPALRIRVSDSEDVDIWEASYLQLTKAIKHSRFKVPHGHGRKKFGLIRFLWSKNTSKPFPEALATAHVMGDDGEKGKAKRKAKAKPAHSRGKKGKGLSTGLTLPEIPSSGQAGTEENEDNDDEDDEDNEDGSEMDTADD